MKSVILLAIIISSLVSLSKSQRITIDLHHPDLSPNSPLYDPSLSHYQRVAIALQRLSPDLHRRRNLRQTARLVATITNMNGDYFMTYAIGTPPISVQSTFNTASDLIWTPCNKLIAGKSKSLRNIPCKNRICKSFPETSNPNCTTAVCHCPYELYYADGTFNTGSLSTETITLGSSVFPNIALGCATNYSGSNIGSLGFGGGPVSLIRQLVALGNIIEPLFSYCLVSIDSDRSTSTLHLGDTAADVSRDAAISLVQDKERPTFYLVHLGSIKVGKKKAVAFGKNVILSTGTVYSQLPYSFYNRLIGALMRSFGTRNVTPDPTKTFDLCYTSLPDIFPGITLRFGKVEVKWKQENVFAKLDQNLWCFAASWIYEDQDAILGSIAQANFLVGFNLKANTVNFQPKNCSRSN